MSFGYKHTYHILWQIIYADDSLLTYEIKKTHIQFMLSSVMWTNNPHGTHAHTYTQITAGKFARDASNIMQCTHRVRITWEKHTNIDHISQLCCSLYASQTEGTKAAFIFTADRIRLPLIHHTEILRKACLRPRLNMHVLYIGNTRPICCHTRLLLTAIVWSVSSDAAPYGLRCY